MRVIKTLDIEDKHISCLHWDENGLTSGTLEGSIIFYPRDETSNGGICHIGAPKTYDDIHSLSITSICFCGGLCVSCGLDGKIAIINTGNDEFESKIICADVNDAYTIIGIDNRFAVVGTISGKLYKINVLDDKVEGELELASETICKLEKNKMNNRLLAMDSEEVIEIDYENMNVTNKIKLEGVCCTCLSVSDDGLTAIVTTTEGTVRVVDLVAWRQVGCTVFEHNELNRVGEIEFGRRFVVGGSDGRVAFFNLTKMIKEKGLKIGNDPILAMAIQYGGNIAAVSGCTSSITFLDYN